MTAEAIARMERELTRLQEAITSIQDSYGQDHLHLMVREGISDKADRQRAGCKISGAISTRVSRRISNNCRNDINVDERGRLTFVESCRGEQAGRLTQYMRANNARRRYCVPSF
jgi:hypothetical protein